MGCRRLGKSAGSYSRSASRMVSSSPLASLMPRRSAAPLPWFCGWRMRRTRCDSTMSLMVSRQPSVEPSSTTRISVVMGISTISSRSRAMRKVSRSLYTGITIVRLWWFMSAPEVGSNAGGGGSIRPGRRVVPEQDAGESPQPGDDQRLDDDVAQEPRQLGCLTTCVARPLAEAQLLAAVVRHRLGSAEVTETRAEEQLGHEGPRDADRAEGVVDQQRAARRHLGSPAADVVTG